MFRGINAITLDVKGRFGVPTRYRDSLAMSVVLTIDPEENCLLLYRCDDWQEIETKLQHLPSFNTAARRIQRLLIGYATDVEIDTNGRLLVPQLLRDYARLDKRALLVGQGNKLEIWDEQLWQERCDSWLAADVSPLESLPEEMKTFYL